MVRANGNGASAPAAPLPDELGKAIIAQLQQDGRRPYAAIGKAVGLSEAAVRQRVQRLVDNRTVQIVAVADPRHLGFERQAMIAIRATGDVEQVAEDLGEIEEIDYLVITAGAYDLIAEVVVVDDTHMLEVLRRIRACTGVTATETLMYLKLAKETYNWGTR